MNEQNEIIAEEIQKGLYSEDRISSNFRLLKIKKDEKWHCMLV